jgi:hypothetical protein
MANSPKRTRGFGRIFLWILAVVFFGLVIWVATYLLAMEKFYDMQTRESEARIRRYFDISPLIPVTPATVTRQLQLLYSNGTSLGVIRSSLENKCIGRDLFSSLEWDSAQHKLWLRLPITQRNGKRIDIWFDFDNSDRLKEVRGDDFEISL